MMRGFIYALLTILVATSGQLILKIGIEKSLINNNLKSLTNFSEFLLVFIHPLILLGLLFYAFSALLWIVVLTELNLSVAYPILGLSYVLVLFFSYIFLGESLSAFKIFGTIFVLIGIIFIGVESKG